MPENIHQQPETDFSRETGTGPATRLAPESLSLTQAIYGTDDFALAQPAPLSREPVDISPPVDQDLFGNPLPPVQANGKATPARCRSDSPGKESPPDDRHRTVTEGAVPWYIYHSGNSVKVEIYSGEVCVSTPPPATPSTPPPKRTAGDIDTFSRKSRMRVFQAFNRLQAQLLGAPLFITLTSRHGELTCEEFQYRFHKKFLPGLKKIIPECVYIWRLQPHLSGKPHYHLMVWSFRKKLTLKSEYYKRPIRALWRDCIGQHDKAAQLYSCDIEPVAGMRKAFQYVSRYVAREDEGKALEIPGRRWGRSLNYPANPIAEITLSRERYNQLLEIVKIILRSKGKDVDWINERVNDGFGWFVWFTHQEIQNILYFIQCNVSLNRYNRYLKSGIPEPSDEELADLGEEYGYDFAPHFTPEDLEDYA